MADGTYTDEEFHRDIENHCRASFSRILSSDLVSNELDWDGFIEPILTIFRNALESALKETAASETPIKIGERDGGGLIVSCEIDLPYDGPTLSYSIPLKSAIAPYWNWEGGRRPVELDGLEDKLKGIEVVIAEIRADIAAERAKA